MDGKTNTIGENKAVTKTHTEHILIQKHRNQINLIEKKHTDTILSLIRSYEKQLKEQQQLYNRLIAEKSEVSQETIESVEHRIKRTLTWRVGFFLTHPARLIRNHIKRAFYSIQKKKLSKKEKTKPVSEKNTIESVADNNRINLKDKQVVSNQNYAILNDQPFVLCILDDFTEACFKNEFNILSPSPQTWEKCFVEHPVSAVFVESAWHGNGNSWEFLLSNYGGTQRLETLSNLLLTAKKKDIPTIFWNKEDPVHFEGFTDTVKMFDYVYTSDADCIPKYLKIVNHKNVYPLPFAAQHTLHNPINSGQRNKTVAFAGSYYNFHYAERKLDLDILLKPAMDFGLEIYDRNFGAKGLAYEEYKFPEIFQTAIKGSLNYQEMLNAYKEYKVFMNVNSVKYSPTMFARRAIELLACGTPVISNYSQGIINLLGEDTVSIVENENETKACLEKLLGDNHYWWRKSLQGIRKVMEAHTYERRTEEIFSRTQIPFPKKSVVKIMVVVKTSSISDIQYVSELIKSQNHPPGCILIAHDAVNTISPIKKDEIKSFFSDIKCEIITEISNNSFARALSSHDYSHLALVNPKNYYGDNYLRDYVLAINYTNARILGKKDNLALSNSGGLTIPELKYTYKWVDALEKDTMIISKDILNSDSVIKLLFENNFHLKNDRMFSIDPFNYLYCGKDHYLKSRKLIYEMISI